MANTIMSAKNSFQEGLIMDFAPDNTQATCLTSALNATLLTFNGNEMSLQNDMGNGRVETAYLPEGYIPVGTCEFGDIIYIVSYNPLTDKSQIGCFPSPERNISTEELYDNTQVNLSYTDFQETTPTGKLIHTSAKKVLIDSKKLNPGDKYIIYTDSNSLKGNKDKLSDFHINAVHKELPSYVKLHVVSIDDSGKITYLDTTTKWYDIDVGTAEKPDNRKYYIHTRSKDITNPNSPVDIDSYRNLLQSGWSIFSSKVSGKLAILAELEMINSFSCSYSIELVGTPSDHINNNTGIVTKYQKYNIYLHPEYTSSHPDIKPSHICLTKAFFNNNQYKKKEEIDGKEELVYIGDDSVVYSAGGDKNNPNQIIYNTSNQGQLRIQSSKDYGWEYEKIDEVTSENITYKEQHIGTVEIPFQQKREGAKDWEKIESGSFVYSLEVTPTMPYGRLDHLAVPLTIDFNKIGTGEVSLNTWKYHISDNTAILTFGFDAYPKPNEEISSIAIQFYDNQGIVGEYLLNDKKYYSGTFTEYFGLNGRQINSRFNKQYYNGEDLISISHKGEEIINEKVEDSKLYVKENGKVYLNDACYLYSGFLYAAKIIVTQRHKDTKKESKSDPIYRWFWTNPMFNEYYYSVKDFKDLQFELILNGDALFETTEHYLWKTKELNNLANDFTAPDNYKTYSANVQYIGYSKENNINMYVNAGLQNNYNCFNLHGRDEKGNIGDIKNINLDIHLSTSEIKYNVPEQQYEFSGNPATVSDIAYLQLKNQTDTVNAQFESTLFDNYLEDPSSLTKAAIRTEEKNIKDKFNIFFTTGGSNDDLEGIKGQVYNTQLDKCYYISEKDKASIPLSMQAMLFNKAYVQGEQGSTLQVPVYTPIIESSDDLEPLGIVYSILEKDIEGGKEKNVLLAFDQAVALNHRGKTFSATRLESTQTVINDKKQIVFNQTVEDDYDNDFDESNKLVNPAENTDFLNTVWTNIGVHLPTFFPVYFGGWGSNNVKHFNAIAGTSKRYISTENWVDKKSISDTDINKQKSQITEGSFDIEGNRLTELKQDNSTSFLGVRYKNGMTLFNTAFLDSIGTITQDDGEKVQVFNQKAARSGQSENFAYKYDNFAYQLFLLLTNTYHKNKRIENEKIKIKNYVRNADYDMELVKHIIIRMEYNNEKAEHNNEKANILMKGFDFNNYVELVCKKPELGYDEKEQKLSPLAEEKNVNLKFLSFAKDHELKISVKSEPMSFFETDVEAYIKRNGLLYPVSDLAPNVFYVYQNGDINQYSNSTLIFPNNEISTNLKSVFDDLKDAVNNPTLVGAHPKSSQIYEPEDAAYNQYLDYIKGYITSEYMLKYEFVSRGDAITKMNQYIIDMFATFPDSVNNFGKNYIQQSLNKTDVLKNGDSVNDTTHIFNIYQDDATYMWIFDIRKHIVGEVTYDKYYKKSKTITASHCEFTTHRFLSLFDYQDQFTTKSTQQIGDTFGIRDGGTDENSAYTGFARDLLLDTKYKVV